MFLQIGHNGCAAHPAMRLAAGEEEYVMSKSFITAEKFASI